MEKFVVNAPSVIALEQRQRIQEGHPEIIIPHLDCRSIAGNFQRDDVNPGGLAILFR
jgi:hypothetical protein